MHITKLASDIDVVISISVTSLNLSDMFKGLLRTKLVFDIDIATIYKIYLE